MHPESEDDSLQRHRLHPSSLLFSFLGQAKQFFLPFLLLFFAAGDSWELWFALLIIPVLVFDTYRFLTMRYRFAPAELIVTGGVLTKNERHVPYARIQNIDLKQGPIQRLLEVAEVRIETASGAEPEAIFKVLSLSAVQRMRGRVFAERGEARPEDADEASAGRTEPAPRPELINSLGPKDLILLGLNPGRGMGVVAVLWGLAWQMGLFDGALNFESILKFFTGSEEGSVLGYSALALGFLVSLFLLSITWHFLRLFDYRLELRGDDFLSQGGLFTRHSTTIPRQRIQLISISESPLQRWMQRVSVKVETAGGTGQPAESRHWFAPLIHRHELQGILTTIDPHLQIEQASWQSLAPGYRYRMHKLSVIIALGIAAICQLIFWPWGWLSLIGLLPLFAWATQVESKYIAYARTGYGILFRNGAFWRQMSLTMNEKVQVVSQHQSPFDRGHRMASLRVDTAGAGQSGHKINVPYLPTARADELQADLVAAAGRGEFSW